MLINNNNDSSVEKDPLRVPVILVVFGTRPEAIKLAPVIRRFRESTSVRIVTVTTGQHKALVHKVTSAFGITPDYDLMLSRKDSSLNNFSSQLMLKIDEVISSVLPSAVLVQGDTSTACMSGIAAFNRQIPIVHLEAGLRSHDITSPFPEEGNRLILSHIARLNLCPSRTAFDNLVNEGINRDSCVVVGNTVIDALFSVLETDASVSNQRVVDVLNSGRKIILVTAHRRENWGAPLFRIASAIRRISDKYPEHIVVLPVHGNPMLRAVFEPQLSNVPNVVMTSALDYSDFARLLNSAFLVLTDSGGIQEEAPALGKPVLVLRDTTERVESLEGGTIRLVGTQVEAIVQAASDLIDSSGAYWNMAYRSNPYGEGNAAQKCVREIEKLLISNGQ